jgi:hypothetical protein
MLSIERFPSEEGGMSATGKVPWIGGMAQDSWSVDAPDHCEAQVAHLYRVLYRYRSLASESRWAESDGRPWVRTGEGERPAATGASHHRVGRQGP